MSLDNRSDGKDPSGFDLLAMVGIPEQRPRVPHEIAQVLRTWIVNGAAPGEFLPTEKLLVERSGVSRPTIREAIRILEAEGLVTIKRGVQGGAVVRAPDIYKLAQSVAVFLQRIGATIAEVFDLRCLIEPEAARRTALRPDRDHVAAVLDAALVREKHAAHSGDPVQIAGRIVEFHNVVLALSEHRGLATFGQLLEAVVVLQNARGLAGADDPVEWAECAHVVHRRIATAMKAGNAARAADLTRKHLDASRAVLIADEIDLTVSVVAEPPLLSSLSGRRWPTGTGLV